MRHSARLVALTLGSAVSTGAFAVPLELPTQGRLLDATAVPLDGAHDLTFSLYDAPVDGEPLWSDTFTVDLQDGYYAVSLGSDVALDPQAFDGEPLFLGITVGDDDELPTRQPLLSVPYALHAASARDVAGGVVDATEIRVNGETVIDSQGALVSDVEDTLSGLGCSPEEIARFDGADWTCAPHLPAHEHDAGEITSGTLAIARLPIGLTEDHVASGNHTHQINALPGVLLPDQLPSELPGMVEGWVTDGALNLDPGTTVGGQAIVTGSAYTDADAVDAMGALGDGNPLNHGRYTDAEARAAMNANAVGNPLNHDRFTAGEAVSAMGTRGDGNPLNHDRFTADEAVSALTGVGGGAIHFGGGPNDLPTGYTAGAYSNDGATIRAGYPGDVESTTLFIMVNDNHNDAVYIGASGNMTSTSDQYEWHGLKVEASGNAILSGTLASGKGALYSDLAENVPTAPGVEAGDVVSVRADAGTYGEGAHFVRADRAYDPRVVGVISDSATLTMALEDGRQPLALSGLVKVKADASYGAIQPGDLLTASPTPGHAMRAEDDVPGAIVGKALEPLHDGTGRVLMLVVSR